jgi:hypothetical protein
MPAGGQEITGEQGGFGSNATTRLRSRKDGQGAATRPLTGIASTASQGSFLLGNVHAATGSAITSSTGNLSSPVSSAEGWLVRSTRPSVVRAFSLDEVAQLNETTYDPFQGGVNTTKDHGIFWPTSPWSGTPANFTAPSIDTTIKPPGMSGSLKFTQPPTTATNLSGDIGDHGDDMGAWFFNAYPYTSLSQAPQGFWQNQKFFVQWRQRFNQGYVDEILRIGNWVQLGIKQLIVNKTDGSGTFAQSSSAHKTVVQTYAQFRAPHIYSGHDGTNVTTSLLTSTGANLQSERAAVSGFTCNANKLESLMVDDDIFITPPASCAQWVADEWMTFQLMIENGPYDSASQQFDWTVAKFWMGREGGEQELIHHWDSRIYRAAGVKGAFIGGSSNRLGKFWFTPYMTGYNGGNIQTLTTWVSQVILDTEFIPDPIDPNPIFDSLEAGEALELCTYTCTQMSGGGAFCESVTDYSGMVWDADRNRVLIPPGGGHASTNWTGLNTLDLGGSTFTWSQAYPSHTIAENIPSNFDFTRGVWLTGAGVGPFPRPAARHTLGNLHIVDSELINLATIEGNGQEGFTSSAWDAYRVPPGSGYTSFEIRDEGNVAGGLQPKVPHQNLDTYAFTFSTSFASINGYGSSAYDPQSEKIIVMSDTLLSTYDPVTKTRTDHINFSTSGGSLKLLNESGVPTSSGLIGINGSMTYFPEDGRLYYISNGAQGEGVNVFRVELDRSDFANSIVRILNVTGTKPTGGEMFEMHFAYDSVNEIIGGAVKASKFYAFHPTTKVWEQVSITGGLPGDTAFHAHCYASPHNVHIFVTTSASGRKTWAFRYGTG